MATHTFYLYRYQLLPITKQYDLRYDLDEIIRNKNEYFKNAILQLKHELPKSKKRHTHMRSNHILKIIF